MAQTLIPVPTTELTTAALEKTMAQAIAANAAATANLSIQQLKAIGVYSLLQELATAAADYSANTTKLRHDTARTVGLSAEMQNDNERIRALCDWNSYQTPGTSVATLVTNSRELAELPEEELDRIAIFLRFQLG